MFPLFETIRVAGGHPCHIAYHNSRLNRSRRELFGSADAIDLGKVIKVHAGSDAGDLRCRVTYGETIGEVSFTPYSRKPVGSLALVDGSGLEYAHKFVDRSGLDGLLAGAGADDILIVRNGLVTDASYANVAFYDGVNWLTPASPLLPGTARARLLDEGVIHPAEIDAADLGRFSMAVLMNAMLGFDLEHPVPAASIRPR